MNLLKDNNYQIDTSSQGSKVMKKLIDNQKTLMTEPRSISNVVTQTINISPNKIPSSFLTYNTTTTKYELYNGLTGQNNGYIDINQVGFRQDGFPYSEYGEYTGERQFLQKISSLKLNNVKEIQLSTSLSLEAIPYSPIPTPSSDYSIKFYIALSIIATQIRPLTFIQVTLSWNNTLNTWSLSENQIDRSLSNISTETYTDLTFGTSQGFNSNPTGISQENFDALRNDQVLLYYEYGFDKSEASALTGADLRTYWTTTTPPNSNKAHFMGSFIGDAFIDDTNGWNYNPAYNIIATLNFNYFGLLSPYTPNS